jgi:hypothetical protein
MNSRHHPPRRRTRPSVKSSSTLAANPLKPCETAEEDAIKRHRRNYSDSADFSIASYG